MMQSEKAMKAVESSTKDEMSQGNTHDTIKNKMEIKHAISLLESGNAVSLLENETIVAETGNMPKKEAENGQLGKRALNDKIRDKRKLISSGTDTLSNGLSTGNKAEIGIGATALGLGVIYAAIKAYNKHRFRKIMREARAQVAAERSLAERSGAQEVEPGNIAIGSLNDQPAPVRPSPVFAPYRADERV